MPLAPRVSSLAARLALEFKSIRAEIASVAGASGTAAQVGYLSLPNSPYLGQTVSALLTSGTTLPAEVYWDSGGVPNMANSRRMAMFVWDGVKWLGTYGPAFAASATLSENILSLAPVGYWKLDESSGTTAVDSSGNGLHGTYTGSYTLNSRNGAPTFGGGYVVVPDANTLSVPSDGALTLFGIGYATTNENATQFYLAKGHWDGYNYEYGMGIHWPVENRASYATWWTPGGDDFQVERSTDSHPLNRWVALSAPIGVSKTALARFPLYRDSGTPLTTTQGGSTKGSSTPNTNGTYPLRIGSRADGTGPFYGSLRHIAIFPRALTQGEISSLMTSARDEGLII